MTTQDIAAAQARIAAAVGEYISALSVVSGLTEGEVIAAAHAQIVAMMVTRIGGQRTADLCCGTGERIRDMPTPPDLPLAFATPAGTA